MALSVKYHPDAIATMPDDEGAIYISAHGAYYAAPDVDAGTLAEALINSYVQEQLDKTSSKIFSGMYSLRVLDADGEEVEDVSRRVRGMVEAPGVLLWSRMRQAWWDIWSWGPCILYPKWSLRGAEAVLQELRRLPPESFSQPPSFNAEIYSDLLPGIVLEDGELAFYQVQDATSLTPVKLRRGVVLLKDPTSAELAGTSRCRPLVPLVKMVEFCWGAQMQKINRVGAPIMFIKLSAPYNDSDKQYAQTILNNWGKGQAYQLRPNMELVSLDISDNEHALNTIAALERRIAAPFRPASSLDKEGASIGGNAAAQKESEDDWLLGQRAMIEDLFEGLLQQYLVRNGYDGWSIELQIAARTAAPGDLELRQAQMGWQSRALSINEVRTRLGAPELGEEELAALAAEWELTSPSAADDLFGEPLSMVERRARIVRELATADPIDPERYMTHEEQMRFLRRTG